MEEDYWKLWENLVILFRFRKKATSLNLKLWFLNRTFFYILFLYFSSSFTLFLRFVVHVIASYHSKIAIVKLWNIVEIMHFNIVKKKAPTSSLSDISRKEFLNVLYLEIHRSDMLSKVRLLFRDFWRHIWQFGRIYTREHMHECRYIHIHTSPNKFSHSGTQTIGIFWKTHCLQIIIPLLWNSYSLLQYFIYDP